MLKMIATSGFLTALECTKFVFGRGSATPPSWFKGDLLLRGRGGQRERMEMGKGSGNEEEKGRGEWRREVYAPPPSQFLDPPDRCRKKAYRKLRVKL